jgi:hypothetical protein
MPYTHVLDRGVLAVRRGAKTLQLSRAYAAPYLSCEWFMLHFTQHPVAGISWPDYRDLLYLGETAQTWLEKRLTLCSESCEPPRAASQVKIS